MSKRKSKQQTSDALQLNGDEPQEPTNGEATPEPFANLAVDLTAADGAAVEQLANDIGDAALAGYIEKKEQLDRIFQLEDEVFRCKNDWLSKAESAKDARKCLEAAQDTLNRFIRRLKGNYRSLTAMRLRASQGP